jgi:transglutaminase-like putative cysteine protease
VDTRSFRFTYDVVVPPADGATRVWIPRPLEDGWQRCTRSAYPEQLAPEEGADPASGNQMVCLTVPSSPLPTSFAVSFELERTLARPPLPPDDQPYPAPPSRDPELARYLLANRKVPTDGAIVEEARALGEIGDPPLRLARRVFHQLIESFDYDRRGCTPARMGELSDLPAACDIRLATCTEFHGLFVARMRALGVPTRFVFGFNVPPRPEGMIHGYHCWAMIASPAGGWIPMDVSEARKQPDRREFYFGALDPNRVAFTWDRDVPLVPAQRGEPLDRFIFPYGESAEKTAVELELGFRFAEL